MKKLLKYRVRSKIDDDLFYILLYLFVGISRCCEFEYCCLNPNSTEFQNFNSTDYSEEEPFIISKPRPPSRGLIPNQYEYDYNYNPVGPVYEQASFWVLFVVLILVLSIVIRSVYLTIKPSRLVELLKRMSTGPLSETKQGPEGNIEPVLHYYNPNTDMELPDELQSQEMIKHQTKKAKKWIRQKMKDNKVHKLCEDEESHCVTESETYEQILDARKLLTRQLAKLEKSSEIVELDNSLNRPTSKVDISKKDYCDHFEAILQEKLDGLEEEEEGDTSDVHALQHPPESRRPSSSYDLAIAIPGPLTPCYQPNLVVSNVWSTNMNMQRLYRYTTMQGIIYPPGYVP